MVPSPNPDNPPWSPHSPRTTPLGLLTRLGQLIKSDLVHYFVDMGTHFCDKQTNIITNLVYRFSCSLLSLTRKTICPSSCMVLVFTDVLLSWWIYYRGWSRRCLVCFASLISVTRPLPHVRLCDCTCEVPDESIGVGCVYFISNLLV